MTDTIFRPEAVEHRARGRDTARGVVRLGAPWLTWLYLLTLALVAAGVVCLFTVHVEQRVTGPAVVDRSTGAVTALLPAASAPDLTESQGLTLTLPGGGDRPLTVDVRHVTAADAAQIRDAGLEPLAQPGILLSGSADGAAGGQGTVRTTATVGLGDERLVDALGRQFQAMLGHREAQR